MGEEESILPGGGRGQDVGWTPSSAAPAPLRSPGHGWQRSCSCWAASAVGERILWASSERAWRVPAGLRGGCGSFCVPVLPFITSLDPVLRLPTFQLAWQWATSLPISLPLPLLSLLLSLLPFSFLHLPGAFQLHLIFFPSFSFLPSASSAAETSHRPRDRPPGSPWSGFLLSTALAPSCRRCRVSPAEPRGFPCVCKGFGAGICRG